MLEELFKWRMENRSTVGAYNRECAMREAAEEKRPYKAGRAPPPGHLSQASMLYKLRDWYGNGAPAQGTLGKYTRLVNCDNAGYFFKRLGEKDWESNPFSLVDIADGFYGT